MRCEGEPEEFRAENRGDGSSGVAIPRNLYTLVCWSVCSVMVFVADMDMNVNTPLTRMYPTGERGVLTTASTPFMYNNGFWALEFTQAQGFACDFWVPFMSGYGGITVAMMPSGATYWYVSDNSEYDWQDVIATSEASVASSCTP